jgi:hypothetical protein
MRTPRPIGIKDHRHPHGELPHPAHCGLGQRKLSPKKTSFRHARQACGVSAGRAGMRENGVIAGHLTVQGEPMFNPPDAGQKEQQRLQNLLRQVGPIVAAPQMRQLMHHDVLQLLRRRGFEQPGWQNDGRFVEANRRWHFQFLRNQY